MFTMFPDKSMQIPNPWWLPHNSIYLPKLLSSLKVQLKHHLLLPDTFPQWHWVNLILPLCFHSTLIVSTLKHWFNFYLYFKLIVTWLFVSLNYKLPEAKAHCTSNIFILLGVYRGLTSKPMVNLSWRKWAKFVSNYLNIYFHEQRYL